MELPQPAFKKYKVMAERMLVFFESIRDALGIVAKTLMLEVQKDFKTIKPEAKDWFWHSWRRKYQLTYRRVSGLTRLLPKDATRRVSDFHKLLGSVNAKQTLRIFLCGDETAIHWEESPNVTLEHKGSNQVKVKASGQKQTAVTVWLASLFLGHAASFLRSSFSKV